MAYGKSRMINRRQFLAGATAVTASSALTKQMGAVKGGGRQSPNLLFIFPDQFRLQALGIWQEPGYRQYLRTVGDPVHTPALNRLARESLLLTQACSTSPICSPSRAMLMSGVYPSQNGVTTNCFQGRTQGLHDEIQCLTDVLAGAGYETAYIGKTHWERNRPLFDVHGNYVGTATPPGGNYVNPYDTYISPGKGRHGNRFWFQDVKDQHYDPWSYSSAPALVGGKKDGEPYRSKQFSPRLEADVLIGYLKNSAGQRNANKPFSIIWAPNPPHTPYFSLKDCDEEVFRKYYKDVPIDKLLNRPNVDVAKAVASGHDDPSKCAPIYFSLVSSIDQQVDCVLQALQETGEAENTIVVFTSDHGEMMGSHGLTAKSVIYDEAFLIPFMIRFPGQLKPRVDDTLLGRVDVMPTILGLMGLNNSIPASVRGIDFSRALLTGRFTNVAKPRSAVFLMQDFHVRGVRTDRYTYQVDDDGKTNLFDNTADPYQMKNLPLATIDSMDLKLLQSELGRWLKVAADPWYENATHKELITYPGGTA